MGYEVIKRLAKERGISLEQLAQGAGLSYNSLSKIVRNTIGEPKLSTMKAIAMCLEMSTDELAIEIGLSPLPPDAKKEAPTVRETAELLRDYFRDKVGRDPTPEEFSALDKFTDTFIRGLNK